VPDRRLAFIHLPRTGGTAVQHHLEAIAGRANVARVGLPSNFLEQLDDLRSSPIVVGHFFYPVLRLIQGAAVATVVRDPVERSISVWEHARWHPSHPDQRLRASREIHSIDDFAEDPYLGGQVRNNQTRFLGAEWDLEAIVAALESGAMALQEAVDLLAEAGFAPADTVMLERAKRRLERMLVVGVTEELSGFVRVLDSRMGFVSGVALTPVNAAPPEFVAHRGATYDDATRQRLAELNSLDAELYMLARKLWEAQRDRIADQAHTVAEPTGAGGGWRHE
jgi:exonuclease VII small subunit